MRISQSQLKSVDSFYNRLITHTLEFKNLFKPLGNSFKSIPRQSAAQTPKSPALFIHVFWRQSKPILFHFDIQTGRQLELQPPFRTFGRNKTAVDLYFYAFGYY